MAGPALCEEQNVLEPLHLPLQEISIAAAMDQPPDHNEGPNILIACGICVGIALLLVALRIYVRVWWTKNFGIDDYCMVGAMVCLVHHELVTLAVTLLILSRPLC
jgi:hypothetical protein